MFTRHLPPEFRIVQYRPTLGVTCAVKCRLDSMNGRSSLSLSILCLLQVLEHRSDDSGALEVWIGSVECDVCTLWGTGYVDPFRNFGRCIRYVDPVYHLP